VFLRSHHLSLLQPEPKISNRRSFSMTEFVDRQISPLSMVKKIKIPSHRNSLFPVWKKLLVLLGGMVY
jgi:hypothetical protein